MYTSTDVVGCEIGGAVKNVIAIAAGVADGLGCGMNTMAALVTRGLAELTRLGVALGGDPLTFLGLAGNGDLIATCGSPLSRNHRVGRELAAGWTIEEVLGGMTSVAEGVTTAPVVVELARRHGVEMPIAETVAALLDGRIAPATRSAADGPSAADRAPRPRHGIEAGTRRTGRSPARNPRFEALPAASIAHPVVRACMTSEWSPKIDRAWVAIRAGGDVHRVGGSARRRS